MEALQESYIAVLTERARFSGGSSFKTFLFGVIRMTVRATRRKAMLRSFFWAPVEAAEEIAEPPAQERATDAARIDAAFADLPPRQREVAELVLSQGFTVTEAAEAMGVSRGAASRHYAAAKTALRVRLKIDGSRNG